MVQTKGIITDAIGAARKKRDKYSFRAFYISTLVLCTFALVSLARNQYNAYSHGGENSLLARRAIEELDPGRVVKTDQEVCALYSLIKMKC